MSHLILPSITSNYEERGLIGKDHVAGQDCHVQFKLLMLTCKVLHELQSIQEKGCLTFYEPMWQAGNPFWFFQPIRLLITCGLFLWLPTCYGIPSLMLQEYLNLSNDFLSCTASHPVQLGSPGDQFLATASGCNRKTYVVSNSIVIECYYSDCCIDGLAHGETGTPRNGPSVRRGHRAR